MITRYLAFVVFFLMFMQGVGAQTWAQVDCECDEEARGDECVKIKDRCVNDTDCQSNQRCDCAYWPSIKEIGFLECSYPGHPDSSNCSGENCKAWLRQCKEYEDCYFNYTCMYKENPAPDLIGVCKPFKPSQEGAPCKEDRDCVYYLKCENDVCTPYTCPYGYEKAIDESSLNHTCKKREGYCESDENCSGDESCEPALVGYTQCTKLECLPHERPVNHKCVPHECTNNSDCDTGYECVNHTCREFVCAEDEYLDPSINECVKLNCSEDEYIENHECVKLICKECEYTQNHSCVRYECCEDVDCKGDEVCKEQENKCIKLECGGDEYAADHTCKKIECDYCQYLANRTCIDYECCDSTPCRFGEHCLNHKCVNLSCKGDEMSGEHECVKLECPFGEYASNHECVSYRPIIINLIIILVVAFIFIVIVGTILMRRREKRAEREAGEEEVEEEVKGKGESDIIDNIP